MKKILLFLILLVTTSCVTLVQNENGLYSEFHNKSEEPKNVRYNAYGLVIVKYKRKKVEKERMLSNKFKNKMNGKTYTVKLKRINFESSNRVEKDKKTTVENPR
jgi:hypothetical protein